LGAILLRKHRYREASVRFQESIDLYERIGDIAGQQHGITNLGIVAGYTGNLGESDAAFRRSIEIAQQTGDWYRETLARENLVELQLIRGELGEANNELQQIIKTWQMLSDRDGEANGWVMLGRVNTLQRNWTRAEEALDVAEKIAIGIDSQFRLIDVHLRRAELFYAEGLTEQALHFTKQVISLSIELVDPYYEALADLVKGICLQASGQMKSAKEALERAQRIFAENDNVYELNRTILALAQWYLQSGDLIRSREYAELSRVAFEELGATLDVKKVRQIQESLQSM
jgi:tetratricopeptide (TPR) repeat protein